jgi:hypothetical protein
MIVVGFDVPTFYIWGVIGSVAVEVGAAVKAASSNGGTCPPPYNQFFYLSARVVLALLAGFLPLALGAVTPVNAFWLGASAPLILDRAASGLQQPDA